MIDHSTQSVVIFGAGEAGRRALRCLRREPGWSVVAFADNAKQRQGTTVEGLPVVAPSSLPSHGIDRIVVASQGAAQIIPQLRAIGIASSCIDIYQVAGDEIRPIPLETNEWPRILLLTDDCLSPGHGTGAVLLRHFAEYPRERLVHVYLRLKGDPFLPHSFKVAPGSEIAGAAVLTGPEKPPMSAAQLVAELQASHGPIDLIYSNFFGETGLTFLSELLDELPGLPVIHHVHDLLTESDTRFDALLRALSPRISEFWAVGPGLADRVRNATHRDVILMNTFSCQITSSYKREHRDVDSTFTAVMLGNSHMPWVLERLRAVWSEIRRVHGVGPIRWFAYPTSVLSVERAGVRINPDIEYYGYLSDRVLHEQLCAADLAIIPFNIADEPEYGYARYSIPSRLTEFLNAGLPVFTAAGRHTEARRFIAHHGIGRCSTIADADQFTRDLTAMIRDTSARRLLGQASRNFAVAQCDVVRYREKLFRRIGSLTGIDVDASRSSAA